MGKFFQELAKDSYVLSVSLLKMLIPVIVLGKIFIELGGVKYIAILLGPPMEALGLPPEFSLVWATTMLTNLTGGILILVEILRTQSVTVEQITILSVLMLVAHSLPVEARVAQKSGLRLGVTLVQRIGGGFVLAWIMHKIYSSYGLLQEPFELGWQPEANDDTLVGWAVNQVVVLATLIAALIVLLFLLRVLRAIGFERIMIFLLSPFLWLLGIRKEAASLAIVGITLGLSYGGALLMSETEKGHISKRDLFASISLLNLCHSMIDDTILMLIVGADESAVIWGRLFFSVIVTAILVRAVRVLPELLWDRYLVRPKNYYDPNKVAKS
ncbi:hypothetical protein [Pseudophaeobacter sp.]|uniref:hypothetical protein n=1 Tax=Pseudophaeobacter sp. TaxID=1971739 RepID=UPI00329771A9